MSARPIPVTLAVTASIENTALLPFRIDEGDAAGMEPADIEEGGEVDSGEVDSYVVDEDTWGGDTTPGNATFALAGVVAIPIGFFLFTAPSTTFS